MSTILCRTCLNTRDLNRIFVNCDDHLHYSLTIFTVTGCKVSEDDGLPQMMCTTCINFVNVSIEFRKKCKNAEKYLLEAVNKYAPQEHHKKRQFKNKLKTIDKDNDSIDSVFIKIKEEEDAIENKVKTDTEEENAYEDIKLEFVMDTLEDDDDDDKPLKYLTALDSDDSSEAEDKKPDLSDDQTFSLTESTQETDSKHDKELEKQETQTPENILQETEVPYEIDLGSDASVTRVRCKICYKTLSIRSIDAHMATKHPGSDRRKIQCDLCEKFVLKNKMKRHKMMMHGITVEDTKSFRCSYCKMEYGNKEALIEHLSHCANKTKKKRKANEASRRTVQCDVCHKSMQRASLRMHKMIKHAGLGPVCEHCGKRFGGGFRLAEHYRAKHGYEKFKCRHCDFTSASTMAMQNHERRHRGEKPFVCETCGAKFHAAYLLTQHRQSHRTERLIKCDQCSASFKANNSLHMHKITCHSDSLYACTMCAKTYSCRHYVVKHLRHFHRYRGKVGPLTRQDKPKELAEE